MHNVDMNMVVAKRCNMRNVFFDFNKYNVIQLLGIWIEMGVGLSTRDEDA
jgi:hypothetical protein